MRKTSRRSRKAGLPPGTLVHTGEKKTEIPQITILDYNEQGFREEKFTSLDQCLAFKTSPGVTWLNVDGLHRIDILEKLGECLGLHPLVLEDILSTDQRPKLEDYGDYLYVVLKMLYLDEASNEVATEQISLVLGNGFVLSFQEKEGDVFTAIRQRIRSGKGQIRKYGADHLLYSLLDAVVDNYFIILEKIGDRVEALEEELVASPSAATLQRIHVLKREMIFLRKAVWPLREVISTLERDASPLFSASARIYLRDVYDHTIHVVDSVETYRDLLSGILDIYLSSISNRINTEMRLLTIFATIFMPLTFIAGVYGMNFKHMPELELRWGYPAALALMATVGVGLAVYFRRKKWL